MLIIAMIILLGLPIADPRAVAKDRLFIEAIRASLTDLAGASATDHAQILSSSGAGTTLRAALHAASPVDEGGKGRSLAWGAQELELSHAAARRVVSACMEAASEHQRKARASGSYPDVPAASSAKLLEVARSGLRELLSIRPAPSSSFPIVRRAVMLALLTSTIDAAEAVWVNGAWHEVLRDLYRLHVRGMSARGVIEHIHISKAAGSTLCQLAQRNMCNTEIFR